ncbi:MAG TPA: PAS domain S-box protein [Anaerolineales bacterium]|nr:PAS domain S-box protein [Anaerolineales bacterium]
METDRKTKAGAHPAKRKADGKIRASTSKSNGKHVEKKRNPAASRAKTAKGTLPTQEELIGTRQRLLATYEQAPIGIVECSPEGKFVNCNRELCHITGYSKEEVLSLSIQDLTYEEDYIYDIKLHQRLVAGEIPFYKLEKRYVRKDGEIIWVELTRNVVRDPDGKALFTIGALLDVTERKRGEKQLRESEERYRFIVENTSDGIWRIELDEPMPISLPEEEQIDWYYQHATIRQCNSGLARMYGYASAEEVVGLPLRIVMPRENPVNLELSRQFIRSGYRLVDAESREVAQDGRELVFLNNMIGIIEDGKLKGEWGTNRDITERKRAEKALTEFARQQEALYKLADQLHRTSSLGDVFDAALDAIIRALQCDRASILLFDDSGVMRFVAWRGLSDSYRKATEGHSPWKPDTQNPEPVWFDDIDTVELSDSLRATIREEGIGSLAFIPLVSNGKLIGKFMAYFNVPHVFSENEVELSLIIARQSAFGIERQRAEEKLRDSEERYRAVVESQAEMLCRFQMDGMILFVNGAYARARGTQPEALVGRSFWDFVTEEDRPSVRAMLEQLTPEAPEVHIENRFLAADGEHWTLWTNRGLRFDAGGRLLEAQSSGIDITERKRAEEKMRESEERFRSLATAMPSIVWTAAPDGTIVYANDKWYEYTGISPEENSRNWLVVLHPDDYDRCVRAWTHALETVPDEYLIEVRNRRHDGEYRWFQTRAVPARDSAGKVTAWYSVTTDIHDRIEAENRLKLLGEISELTRSFEDPNELLYAVSKILGEHLQVKRCLFNETDLEHDRETVYRDYYNGVPSVAGIHKVSDYSRITTADMKAGKTVINHDSKTDPRTAKEFERVYAPSGERAYVAVPLMREDRWVATLWASDTMPRAWSKEEVSLLETVAERTWTAIEKLRIDAALRASEEENRRLNTELQAQLDEMNSLLEILPTGVWIANQDGSVITGNRAAYQILGVEPGINVSLTHPDKDVPDTGVRIFVDGEQVPPENAPMQAVARSGKPWHGFEHELLFPDGTRKAIYGSVVPLFDQHGTVRKIIASYTDFTERKRAEEALRTSEALYRAIARSIPGGGVYVVDRDFRYIVSEGPVTEAFGLSREMLEGHTVLEAFPDERGKRMEERLRRNFAGETVSYETKHKGRVYWTQQAPLLDSLGHVIIVTIDITERKQMEEALRQSEERFVRFMQHLPGLAWIKDLQGRYVYANAAAEKAFNVTREQLYGRTDQEVFPPEVATQFQSNDEQALAEGKGVQMIETLEQPDGLLHYSLVNKFPIPGPDGSTALVGGTAFDITERKQAEEALRRSEERYRNLFDLVPVAVYACDADGLIEEYNHRAAELWGREPEKNDPKEKYCGSFKIYYPDGRFMPHEACPMARMLAGETLEPHELEVLVERPDGVRRNVLAHPLPLKNERGEIVAAINCLYDITERKQAEKALRESEEWFRAIVNQATAGIVRKGVDGRLMFVNQAFCDMLGYSQAELLTKTIWELTHEEDIDKNKELYDRMAEEGSPFKLEKRLIRRDGSILWVDVSVSPVLDSAGRAQSAVAVEVDITGRKEAEHALQELNLQLENRVQSRTAKLQAANQALREEIAERQQAEELLRRWAHIFEHADWGIATIYQDTLTMVNPTFAEMHRYTAEELVGRSVYELYAPESRADVVAQIRMSHEKGHHIFESMHVRKDGSIFPILVDTTVVRNQAGEVLYRAVNVQDITERKQVEQELHESRKHLQVLSRRLVEVQEDERRAIARELHDRVGQTLAALNINLIIMNGQILEDSKQRIGSRLDDSLHLVAEAIALVRNVMTDLRPAVLDDYGLEAALQSYIDDYRSRYDIQVFFDPSDTPIPRLDPGLEMTVLRIGQEALTNVSRHAQARQVNVSLRLADRAIRLTVQDDGVGIGSLQEAYRLSSHGLKIMRERAQAFGGSVDIHSEPGKGTKVEARIPIENGSLDKAREEMP